MSSHIPRKRFGQHFLVDPQVIADIVSAIGPQRGDTLVEIGPGLAAITEPLYARLDHLHVVEIDRDIIARLKKTFDPARLVVHEGDALAFDFGALADPLASAAGKPSLRIVGNLPYNISTPILFHLAAFAEQTIDMHFMLQKEVIDRMVAEPASGDYSRLSVMLQFRFHMENLLDVPPDAFDPPPRVNSAVVRMIPKARAELPEVDPLVFSKVVAAAFGQRRKMLRNTLKDLFPGDVSAALVGLDIAPTARAEELSGAAFVRLTQAVSALE
jgi:16S rRNA (adenine1518-N6/adenine1519-N6)-dimethyltransferase